MIAIAAAGAFAGLFALWVILPKLGFTHNLEKE